MIRSEIHYVSQCNNLEKLELLGSIVYSVYQYGMYAIFIWKIDNLFNLSGIAMNYVNKSGLTSGYLAPKEISDLQLSNCFIKKDEAIAYFESIRKS